MRCRLSSLVALLMAVLMFSVTGLVLADGGTPTISLTTTTPTVNTGASVTVAVQMDFSGQPTLGGGVDITFDAQRLQFSSFEFDAAFADESALRRQPQVLDGVLKGLAFGAPDADGLSGVMLVGRATFVATGAGLATIAVGGNAQPAGGFISATSYDLQSVTYGGRGGSNAITITVAAPATGQLTGQSVVVSANYLVNLTTAGTADWIRWGRATATDVDRKANVTAQISDITPINGATRNRFGGNATYWSATNWSDGSPTASSSGGVSGLYFPGIGKGIQLTVPAGTSLRTVKLYLGAWQAKGKLDVSLSDASAPAYITTINNAADPVTTQIVTLSFRAASAGQTMTIQYTLDTDYAGGNIAIQAATLSTAASGNTAPVLAPIGNKSIQINQALSFTVSATDANNDPLTLSAAPLPSGASFIDLGNNSGRYDWTPTTGQAGSYTLTVTVNDGKGGTASETLTITVTSPVNTAPIAQPGGPYSGIVDTAIAFNGSGSSDPEGQTLTYSWNFGDSGCTPQPACNTASVSNPSHSYAVSGSYTVTQTVTDTGGLTNSKTTTATITAAATGQLTGQSVAMPANHTINLTTAGTADWIRWGRAVATDVDRKANITAQISDITLLNGATRALFGGNTTYWTTPTWSDGTPTASTSGTSSGLYFPGVGKGIQITAPADTTARTLKLYLGAWQASGKLTAALSDNSAAPYTFYIDNATSTVATRIVTLTYQAASASQTLTIKYTLDTDYAGGNIALQAATLQTSSNAAPILAPIGDKSIDINQYLSFSVTATDADNDPLTLTTSALPGTARFSPGLGGSGLFEWTPITSNAGSYPVAFSVSDGKGGTDNEQITLTVTSPAAPGQLTGQSVAVPSNHTVNLTTQGSTDWVRWGRATATDIDRKASVIARISGLTPLNAATLNRFGGNASYWATPTWSDGNPTATHSGNPGGVYITGVGKGVQITVPADTGVKTLTLYLGAWQAKGKLDVSLSDASAAPYVSDINNTADPVTTRIITLDYKAASASQTLTIKYTLDTDYAGGNIALQAATLK